MTRVFQELRAALVVAAATLLEAIRNRILLTGVLFAAVLVFISIAAASISLWERARLIVDVGLTTASGFGSIIAIALTITSFAGELNKRTVFPVLVRPISRWAFVLGKYLGVVATMIIVVTTMVAATALTVVIFGDDVPGALWASMWLNFVEICVVCAIALMFSTMASPVMAAAYTVGMVLSGNLSDDMQRLALRLAERGEDAASSVLQVIYHVLPDLSALSVRIQAANDLDVPAAYIFHGIWYGFSYACVALVISMWIFTRRRSI